MFSDLFLSSQAAGPKLKIGLLVDGTTLIRSFADVLRDIRQSNFAVIDCVVVHRRPQSDIVPTRNRLKAAYARLADRKLRDSLLYELYLRWDTARHAGPDHPLAPTDCAAVFEGLPTIEVQPITSGFVHRFPPDAIESIRGRDLDVLIRFGFNILRGDVLNAARHGIWSFHHGDNEFYRGGPALFWELWEHNPLSGVILQQLTEHLDGGVVLAKSIFATADTMSLAKNRRGPYLATTHFVIRKLHELHSFGCEGLKARRVPDTPYRGRRRVYRTPTNVEMLQWLGGALGARVRRLGHRPRMRTWRVAVRKGGAYIDEAAANGGPCVLSGFNWIDSPSDRYYADPFLIRHDGTTWLFVEEFEKARGKGRLAVAELDQGGNPKRFMPCLDLAGHVSFPFVFEHANELWLIPESAASHEVTLYRARKFPHEWVAERTLLRGDFVDTVVWRDESWWMLTTVREPAGYSVHTLLFKAAALTGEWRLHPASPLFNDVRRARNAGKMVESCGKRYRISQDCSVEYGRAFEFHEIETLNDTVYQERTVARVDPFMKDMVAIHTYNRAGDIETIDGCFLEPSRSRRPQVTPPAAEFRSKR